MTQSTDTGGANAPRSPTSVTVDNVIRRALRVSNPQDPAQVAKALLVHFKSDAAMYGNELAGAPVLRMAPAAPVQVSSAERAELAQAQDDLDRDLDALVNESQLKDVQAELRGWASAIRTAARSGIAAARLALDPNQRDAAFAARRTLSDYARLARYLAALSTCVSGLYCRLAQSCDVMGAMILIRCGESLAASGVTRTSVILQSPASELQVRREAVLTALRNLNGSVLEPLGQKDYPRGTVALRQVHRELEARGAGDLRAFLNESYLGGVFDELIALASDQSGDGMRALGASGVVTVARLERFVQACDGIADPDSPPLTTFLNAILLFVQAFSSARAGYRLVYIARPPLIVHGLYGQRRTDDGVENLLKLIRHRGELAEFVDCLCCKSGDEAVQKLAVLSKMLHDTDLAIDLLVQGTDPESRGDAEIRAAAFGVLAEVLSDEIGKWKLAQSALDILQGIMTALRWDEVITKPKDNDDKKDNADKKDIADKIAIAEILNSMICAQKGEERRWRQLVENMSAVCRHRAVFGGEGVLGPNVDSLLERARNRLRDRLGIANYELPPCPEIDLSIPMAVESGTEALSRPRSRRG